MTERARLQAVLQGKVQGVGFRSFVAHRAQALEIAGYVRNLVDGSSVMVEAEGERHRLERFLVEVQTGPRGALVERVEVAWLEYNGALSGFVIRR